MRLACKGMASGVGENNIYIFSFCEGLMFWYAIEKLFMQSIGLGLSAIVVIGIIAQAGKMVFEIPSSVLADRWNRRNTLLLGTVAIILASVLLPLTTTALSYLLVALLWTIYYAFKSGTDVAFIYDSLKELGHEGKFQHIFARYSTLENVGLIISGVVAGLIVSASNLQVPFWLTIIPLAVGGAALLRLKEPRIGRTEPTNNLRQHAAEAWRDIRRHAIVWTVTLYAMLFAVKFIWYEYNQVYGLAVHTPEVLFGTILSVLFLGQIAGNEVVRKFTISKRILASAWVVLTIVHVGGLLVHTFASFLLIVFVTMFAMQVLYLVLIDAINHKIDSARRATVISLGGSVSQFLFLGLAMLFAIIVKQGNVQVAFLVASAPLLLLAVIDIVRRIPWFQEDTHVSERSFAQAEIAKDELRP